MAYHSTGPRTYTYRQCGDQSRGCASCKIYVYWVLCTFFGYRNELRGMQNGERAKGHWICCTWDEIVILRSRTTITFFVVSPPRHLRSCIEPYVGHLRLTYWPSIHIVSLYRFLLHHSTCLIYPSIWYISTNYQSSGPKLYSDNGTEFVSKHLVLYHLILLGENTDVSSYSASNPSYLLRKVERERTAYRPLEFVSSRDWGRQGRVPMGADGRAYRRRATKRGHSG